MTTSDYEYFQLKVQEVDETNQSFRLIDKTGNSWNIIWEADPDSRYTMAELTIAAGTFCRLQNAVLLSHVKL